MAFVKNATRPIGDFDGIDAIYRYPTPLTMSDDAIKEFLTRLQITKEDGLQGLIRLNEAVSSYIKYCPGATGIFTTAAQAFGQRKGVCQDETQILLSIARLLGYPARYVSGMMLGEGATHAWAEIGVGEQWIGFDPTNCCLVDDRYLCFAHGRDYADCPVEKGIFTGVTSQSQQIFVSVNEE